MTPERWAQISQLYDRARARPAAERAEFLAEACSGDEELRREVEALLGQPTSPPFLDGLTSPVIASVISNDAGAELQGRRLGPYLLGDRIGAGGMGEVYRARDTKLGRDVAIKLLPQEFASNPERLRRFDREARALAALNHPNIAAIYGLDETGGVPALVLELVPGETLAERLARSAGGLSVEETLRIARQLAEALEAAHENGIVHRDLKPANIKITNDGVVKVLDFGLAKATASDSVEPSQGPTVSLDVTRAGIVVGTAAYMSPEQARGLAVDKRTDIWAFGCLLYEMLSGRAPFTGQTISDTIASVLERPPDWTALHAKTPARMRHLMARCLDKNPKQRLRDAGDARLDIDLMLSEPEVAAPPLIAGSRRWLMVSMVLATAATAVAAGILVSQLRQSPPPIQPETRVEITPPARSLPFEFALAPNGRHIVFVAAPDGPNRLWLRSLDKTDAQPLPGTDGAEFPFWSADSRSIGFFASGRLHRIDVGGGPPEPIADVPAGRGGTWNADGVIVLAAVGSPLMRITATGGNPTPVTRLDPARRAEHLWPHFLPDGRHVLYYVLGAPPESGVYLTTLDGGTGRRLTPADSAADYVAPDWLLFARRGALVARHLDLSKGELSGGEVVITDSVSASVGSKGGFSASTGGSIAYQSPRVLPAELSSFNRAGQPLGVVIGNPDASTILGNPELSPDGKRVVVTRFVQNNVDVWVKDLVAGALTRLTTDANQDSWPLWSPRDGTRIVFSSNRTGGLQLFETSFNAAGREQLLLNAPVLPQDWSQDGRFILYGGLYPQTGRDIWMLDLADPAKRRVLANGPSDERVSQFSPDGRWIAYETNVSGRFEVVVQALAEGGAVQPVSRAGGTQARWRADSREIYFVAPGGTLMAARVTPVPGKTSGGVEIGTPVPLFPTQLAEGGPAIFKAQYVVTRDGRFLIAQPREAVTLPLTLLQNWTLAAQRD